GNVSANTSAGQGKVLGRTQYVRHGSFNDVVFNLSTPVNTSQTVSVTIHNDSNGNKTWDGAKTDAAYQGSGGVAIHDTVRLGVNGSEGESTSQRKNATNTTANATVSFANQTTNGSTVTVDSVTLSQPGYVALQSSAYADGLTSAEES